MTTLRRILVGYRASPACKVALRRAAGLAERAGAKVDVASVEIPVPTGTFGWMIPPDHTQALEQIARGRVEEARGSLPESVRGDGHALLGAPAGEIARLAERAGADLIVLGDAERTGIDRLLRGATADRVVRLADVPCLIAASADPARRVLAAVDDSPFKEAVLRAALALARGEGAALRCLHALPSPPADLVLDPPLDLEAFAARTHDRLERDLAGLRGSGDVATEVEVRRGEAADAILDEAASWSADLVVVGSHGHGFLKRAILGSVSERLLRHAPGSLLVVPGEGSATTG